MNKNVLMEQRVANWTSANIPSKNGKIILIPDANSGIGLEASAQLARRGAAVAHKLSKMPHLSDIDSWDTTDGLAWPVASREI
ncbi:MAG TPA: hypothetical protein DCP92_13505 [Nitrospiraceae bacterium]|jgi:hypothetical protein|nr:hypothetical protein [Nitrospiraceae bacterium]